MAARARIVYNGWTTLSGAILAKADADPLVAELETTQQRLRGDTNKTPLDAVEIRIAELVDSGQTMPVSNAEAFQAARWLSQGNLANLPDPMPRAFVLYLAKAWKDAGHYPTVKSAVTDILNTRTFV
jgi:hypothetical protein